MNTIVCNKCNNTIPDDSGFCPFCGERVEKEDIKLRNTEDSENKIEDIEINAEEENKATEGDASAKLDAEQKCIHANKRKRSKRKTLLVLVPCLILIIAVVSIVAVILYKKSDAYIFGVEENSTGVTITKYRGNDTGNIVIPNYINGKPVTIIDDDAFSGCSGFTNITVPDNVTSIGLGAFRDCDNLESMTLPFVGSTKNGTTETHLGYIFGSDGSPVLNGLYSTYHWGVPSSLKTITVTSCTKIGDNAFNGCDSLTSITIPNSVTSIGNGAFSGCDSLTSITIPNSVTSIGNGAFSGCDSIRSISIPDGVLSIGDNTFSVCTSLTSISIPDSVLSIGNMAFSNCDSLTIMSIPDGILSVGDLAFFSCDSLTGISIPDSVLSIGNKAFFDCSSLTYIRISDRVTSIGTEAFSGCNSLRSISIPDSVIKIGACAFFGCDSLTMVHFGEVNGWVIKNYYSTSITPNDLRDINTAAEYLTDTYLAYEWVRK